MQFKTTWYTTGKNPPKYNLLQAKSYAIQFSYKELKKTEIKLMVI